MITGYNGNEVDIVIPEKINGIRVSAIYNNAFANNKKIKSVCFPDSLFSIGEYAFLNCENLSSVQFQSVGRRLFQIEKSAFKNCPGLTNNDGLVIVRDLLFDYIFDKPNCAN